VGVETRADGSVEKKYKFHDYVMGTLKGFKAVEEPTYDDPKVDEWIGYLTLVTPDEPRLVIRFPMERYHGRRMVGLINAAVAANDSEVFFRISYTPSGTVLNEKATDKDLVFLTARAGDAKGEKREPVFADSDGNLLLDAGGRPAKLPEPKVVTIGKKEHRDFAASDEIVLMTAVHLVNYFAAQRQSAKDAHDDASIDPHEAAYAAAPQG
jgi:hypothetical protein